MTQRTGFWTFLLLKYTDDKRRELLWSHNWSPAYIIDIIAKTSQWHDAKVLRLTRAYSVCPTHLPSPSALPKYFPDKCCEKYFWSCRWQHNPALAPGWLALSQHHWQPMHRSNQSLFIVCGFMCLFGPPSPIGSGPTWVHSPCTIGTPNSWLVGKKTFMVSCVYFARPAPLALVQLELTVPRESEHPSPESGGKKTHWF